MIPLNNSRRVIWVAENEPLYPVPPVVEVRNSRSGALNMPFVIASAIMAVSATLRTEVDLVRRVRRFWVENLPFFLLRVGMVWRLGHTGY